MTERCQTKFTENFDNQNYIIYVGILIASLSALYFYRFHFVFILISYVLGCLACYYGLKWNILNLLLQKFGSDSVSNSPINVDDESPSQRGCDTCGSKDCNRHSNREDTEPWVGLKIHKQLDQAIENFYNTIIDQFINSWYSKITLQPFFVDELRHQLRYASANLLKRAIKVDYSKLITNQLLPCALRHYTLCAQTNRVSDMDVKFHIHPAATNRDAELQYLRAVTEAIMPYLIQSNERDNSVFRVLIREIFAGWVLLSLTDVLADPHILNTLIVLATGDETMAQLPDTPNYNVELLETFVRQSESVYVQRSKLLKIDLDVVVNDQEYLYAFMQYMKNTNHLYMLQFYKDIKSFQIKILNPELSSNEQVSLFNEAWDLYITYFEANSPARDLFDPTLGEEFKLLLSTGPEDISKLQRSRALYQASRLAHTCLEKYMIPKFLHSEEFYKLLLGSRSPTGYQKQMLKKAPERIVNSALKLGTKLRGALKQHALDGQVLDSLSNSSSDVISDNDSMDNLDILKYLDALAANRLDEQDLSTYKIVLTNVEVKRPPPPRQIPVREFTVAVHHAPAGADPRFWSVLRSEHDFHLLKEKLHEYHGDVLGHPPLPSRRDNSPLETLRYKYEDYLQRLLQEPLLQTSELLHLFLTVEGDFSLAVQASCSLSANTDIINFYQSVTHKLRKEKGQHLEGFLKNFLISSDVERYQALKQSNHVEEGTEVSEEEISITLDRVVNARDIKRGVFKNNFDVSPVVIMSEQRAKGCFGGFTQCFMYILLRIVRARGWVTCVIWTLLRAVRTDVIFSHRLHHALAHTLSQRRLAHLINLGHGLLFGKKSLAPRNAVEQRQTAETRLMSSIPSGLTLLLGSGLPVAVHNAFELIQVPQFNKQLVYNLLDACLLELFPELGESNTDKPKS